MNSEVFQRAMALASLLEGATVEAFRAPEVETPSTELEWSASVLLAEIMSRGKYLREPLGRVDVENELGVVRLRELEAKGLLRTVSNELCIAHGYNRYGREKLEKPDEADLARLRALSREPSRTNLWISASSLRRCIAAHRRANANTPSIELLLQAFDKLKSLRTDGFLLKLGRGERNGWVDSVVPLAAARLWRILSENYKRSERRQLFDAWFERLRCARDQIVRAIGFLSSDDRAEIARTALDLVLGDPDLGDLERELELRGQDAFENRARYRPPCTSVASTHMFWNDFGDGHDEVRDPIHLLVWLVLEHDSWRQGQYDLTLRLIEGGEARPYLVEAVGPLLCHSYASRIPWLLSRVKTMALALALVAETRINEPTMMDDSPSREERVHQRRVLLFREAVATAVATLLGEPHTSEGNGAVLDTLRALARRCVLAVSAQPAQVARAKRDEELFEIAAVHFTQARRRGVIVANEPDAESLILGEDFGGLISGLRDRFPTREHAAQLKVAFELLRFVREHPKSFVAFPSGTREGFERNLAQLMVQIYEDSLELHDEDASSFRYYFPSPSIATLPWELLVLSLAAHDESALNKWLRCSALAEKLKVLGAGLTDSQRDNVVAGAANRARLHLETMLRAYRHIQTVTATTETERARARHLLEVEIEHVVLGLTDATKGTVSLFDRKSTFTVEDTERTALIERAVAVIDLFEARTRERIFEEWVASTTDPNILMAIGEVASSKSVRERVRRALADDATIETAKSDLSFDVLLRTTMSAATANHVELAQGLIARGDAIDEKHPLREVWEATAFRARLLLSFHLKDRVAVQTLPLPPTAKKVERRAELEASRAFYDALLELDTHPTRGRDAFKSLLAREPTSSALVGNLFAAELRVAKTFHEDDARRAAFEIALRDWQRRAAQFAIEAMEPQASYNVLIALDGAKLDDEFDAYWHGLTETKRARLDLIQVRLENLRRRNFDTDAARLTELVRARFDGDLPPEFTVPSAASKSTDTKDEPDHFRNWALIKGLPAPRLAEVVGPTGTKHIADFLAYVHINAALAVTRHQLSIAALWGEDSINDVVSSFVEMQIAPFGWSVPDQPRVGARRRDWAIKAGLREVAVSEALLMRGRDQSALQNHVTRLVAKYNPHGAEATFVVVYYEGKAFEAFCDGYPDICAKLVFDAWTRTDTLLKPEDGLNVVRRYRISLEKGGLRAFQDHILVDLGVGSGQS